MLKSRILILSSFGRSVVSFRGDLIRALLNARHEVDVAVPAGELEADMRGLSERIVWHELPLVRTGTSPREDLSYLLSIVRLIRHISPDVVLAYNIKPVVWAGIASRIHSNVRFFGLMTGLGYAFIEQGNLKWRFVHATTRLLLKLALAKSEKVFFQNSDDFDEFVRLRIVTRDQGRIVNGSGINLDEFSYVEPPQSSDVTFLLVARLLKDKGIREFVAAARIIRSKHSNGKFCLVGPRDSNPTSIGTEELNQWIKEGVVQYLGYVEKINDVRNLIARCSVYVLPSYREGTPRTVLEAMATGRPIITTDVPGCRQTVRVGENGFLVPRGDIDGLAVAMGRFLADPSLAVKMGLASRRIAEEKYDVNVINGIMLREMALVPATSWTHNA